METTEEGCRMGDHPNLYGRALTILKNKGFKLFISPWPTKEDEGACNYWAIQQNREFIAEDPLRLLGMVSIWEHCGDDWYDNPKIEIEHVMERMRDRAYLDDPDELNQLSEEEFNAFVEDYREFGKAKFEPVHVKDAISREEFYEVLKKFNEPSDDTD